MTTEILIGIILLAINVPFGWFGMILFGYYGKKTSRKIFYILSFLIYIISWAMLAEGVFLCGKDYARYIIDNYIIKYIYPLVFLIIIVSIVMYIYRKKIFNKK